MQMLVNLSLIVLMLIGIFQKVANGLPVSKNDSVPTKRPYENPNLFEGDMVFPKSTGTSGRGVAKRGSDVTWPNGIVPYEISTAFGLMQQAIIIATMQKMERIISVNNYKCVQFRPRNASDIYYITIINGVGCYSYVGQNTGMNMVREVSLQHPGCVYEGIIMHELLHTLGFFHEQSRPDRDSYVRVNYANIQSNALNNFDKYDNTIVNTLNTPYDYSSVMHYERDAFSSNGLPTIEPLQAGVTIGQRANMSAIDIQEVRILYNCSATGQTFAPIPTTTTVNLYRYSTTISSILTSTSQVFMRPSTSSSCYYDRYLVSVYTAGSYIITSTSGLDTYGYLYMNAFVPTSPSSNLIAYDDDNGGNSQFQIWTYLQPNVTYILVATTYSAYVIGSYSLTVSGYDPINITRINNSSIITNPPTTVPTTTSSFVQTSTYSSSLTTGSYMYDRNGGNSYNYYFQAIRLDASVSGFYSIRSVSSVDTYGYLYTNSFNPSSVTTNLVASNDDSAGNNQFLISYSLQTNTQYILVFTTFNPTVTTSFSVVATGPGQVFFNIVNPYTSGTTRTTTSATTTTTTSATTTTTTSATTTTTTSATTTTTTSATTTTTTSATTTTTTSATTTTVTTQTTTSSGISIFCVKLNMMILVVTSFIHLLS